MVDTEADSVVTGPEELREATLSRAG